MDIRRHLRVVVNPCDIRVSRRIDPFVADNGNRQRIGYFGYRLMELRGKRMGGIDDESYLVLLTELAHRLTVHRTVNALSVV